MATDVRLLEAPERLEYTDDAPVDRNVLEVRGLLLRLLLVLRPDRVEYLDRDE